MVVEKDEAAIGRALLAAGCYVVVTDMPAALLSTQQVHDHYVGLQKVERDFRTLKTGLLKVRPVFLRNEGRTQGHVPCFLVWLKSGEQTPVILDERLRFWRKVNHFEADVILTNRRDSGYCAVRGVWKFWIRGSCSRDPNSFARANSRSACSLLPSRWRIDPSK